MKKILVYGTLRQGKPNHVIMEAEKAEFIKNGVVKGYEIYYFIKGHFPIAIKGEGDLVVEMYNVTDRLFELLDTGERNVGYHSVYISSGELEGYMWIMDKEVLGLLQPAIFKKVFKKVESGDYTNFIK